MLLNCAYLLLWGRGDVISPEIRIGVRLVRTESLDFSLGCI